MEPIAAMSNNHKPSKPIISIITVCHSSCQDLTVTLRLFSGLSNSERALIQNIVVLGNRSPELLSIVRHYVPEALVCFDLAQGPYAAMNLGASLASAQFLWFLNAGDLCDPCVTPQILSIISSSKSKIHAFSCEVQSSQSSTTWTPSVSDLPLSTLPHPSLLFDRNLFSELGGFDLNYKYVADRALILQACSSSYLIECHSLVIATYVSRPDALSASFKAVREDILLTLSLRRLPRILTMKDFAAKFIRYLNKC